MANTVRLKRSNTALASPSLLYGELGWNSADSKLYVGNFADANVQVGSVTTLSIVTANGVSGSVATATTTPAITVTLGAITPSSVTVSGVITCSAGSAALPSVTTTGDTNTGIWFPAADTVAISTGGVERFRIDSAGNITGTTLSGTNTGDQTAASLGLVIGTNVQAYDAGLLSIASATTAADRFLYTTALDVYAVGTITTFGRSLVDDADASTARTTLGLVIGTNVQAYDAGLLSIAAATTAADRFLYTTALDVYAVGTITTFGRSLVDDADAATARTTLGLVIGTDVAPVASPTFTGVVTTAGQIAFPATANVSADANTLDDYEEGTFTPTFTGSTTNPTVTYDAAITYGRYTKIGRTVFINLRVLLTAMSSAGSGNIRISGLPFTPQGQYFQLSVGNRSGWTTTGPGIAYVEPSPVYINLGYASAGGMAFTTQANLAATSDVMVSGSYTTSS